MTPSPRPRHMPGSSFVLVRAMLLAAGLATASGFAVLLAVEPSALGAAEAVAAAGGRAAGLWTPPADLDTGGVQWQPDDDRLAAAVLAGLLRQGYRAP